MSERWLFAECDRPGLYLGPCSHARAREAVRRWHYSRCLGARSQARYAAWEDGQFIGCIVFNNGANPNIGSPYGLPQQQVAELIRVALGPHQATTSRILTVAVRLFRRQWPRVQLLVAYADPNAGHVGTLYQACGWPYVGRTQGTQKLQLPDGTIKHRKSIHTTYGHCRSTDLGLTVVQPLPKYTYVLPLDHEIRERVLPLAQPYPKGTRSIDSDAPAFHAGEGGARPTRVLISPAGI